MKQLKLFNLLAAVIVVSMLLAACGPKVSQPIATPPAEEPTQPPAPTDTEAPVPTDTEVAEVVPTDTAAPEGCPDPVGTAAIPFPDDGKSVTGGWTQEPDSVMPYFTVMSYAWWIAQ